MKASLTKAILLVSILLQCTTLVYSQANSSSSNPISAQAIDPAANPDAGTDATTPAATTAAPIPTTTVDPVPTTTAAPIPTTTAAPDPVQTTTTAESIPTTTENNAVPTTTVNKGNNKSTTTDSNQNNNNNGFSRTSSMMPVGTGSASIPSANPTQSNTSIAKKEDGGSNKTAIVAGSVVGALVGVALIAGILTWMNRRGGCTSHTRRRDIPNDYENGNQQYDMKMTENTHTGIQANNDLHSVVAASSDHLPPSPFQHARRFVPPTNNTGYMNLSDEAYPYQQNTMGYHENQSYSDFNDYYTQQQYQQQQNPMFYQPGSNLTSPTITNPQYSLKPNEFEQKPNAV